MTGAALYVSFLHQMEIDMQCDNSFMGEQLLDSFVSRNSVQEACGFEPNSGGFG